MPSWSGSLSFRTLAPFSWRPLSHQEQIDRFKVSLCFLQLSDFRDISSLNLSCLLCEMVRGSAGPQNYWGVWCERLAVLCSFWFDTEILGGGWRSRFDPQVVSEIWSHSVAGITGGVGWAAWLGPLLCPFTVQVHSSSAPLGSQLRVPCLQLQSIRLCVREAHVSSRWTAQK